MGKNLSDGVHVFFQFNIVKCIAVKYNKLSLNSSVNAKCFSFKYHHKAIKISDLKYKHVCIIEMFKNLRDLTHFYNFFFEST